MFMRFFLTSFLTTILLFMSYIPEGFTDDDSFIINTMQPFYTGYYTKFTTQSENNLYLDNNGTLHIAYIDNYELWYAYSTDNGKTWHKEKIPTGHDGDIKCAALVVDRNSTIFVGFTVNDDYNYANPTGVIGGHEYMWDLYCARKPVNGDWTIDKIDTHSSSNYGPYISAMLVDNDNNVHIFAIYHGWWSYGGTAWEYIYSSGTWGDRIEIVKFTDTVVDNCLGKYIKPILDRDGNIYLIMSRARGSNHLDGRYFYVKKDKESASWGNPQELDQVDRSVLPEPYYPISIDATITPAGHIYIIYTKPENNFHKLFFIKDLSSPEVIYTCSSGEYIYEAKIHTNPQGKLSILLVFLNNADTKLLKRDSNGNWSPAEDLPLYTNGNAFDVRPAIVQTDTYQNHFTDFMLSYLGVTASKDYVADAGTLYFYAANITNIAPEITSFTADPISGNSPLKVNFTCEATDPDGQIVSYKWDFNGDGQTDETTPSGETNYTYQNAGTYQATCTVVDDKGAEISSQVVNITVTTPNQTNEDQGATDQNESQTTDSSGGGCSIGSGGLADVSLLFALALPLGWTAWSRRKGQK